MILLRVMCKSCGVTYQEVDTSNPPCCSSYWKQLESLILRAVESPSEEFKLNYTLSLQERDKRKVA